MKLSIIVFIKSALEHFATNKHLKRRSNNIGNKGRNYRGNNGTNDINMDNKISKSFNKNKA